MERKYYELTSGQNILMYSQKYTIHKQVNNICTSVLVEKQLDVELLKKAVLLAYERNDSFNIRLVKVGKEIKQYFADHESPTIEYLDFRGKSFENMEDELHKIAKKRITNFEAPLSKIYILYSHDGRCGLYFVVSHMILDSWSISSFFKDVLSTYQALENGTEMPKARPLYEEVLVEELNYKNTKAYEKDRKYFEDLFTNSTEPIFNHINGISVLEKYRKKKKNPNLRYGQVFDLRTKAKNVMFPLSKEVVEKMEGYCAENKVTMQALVLLAYRSYLSKVNNNEKDINLYTVMARRGTLREKNTGGSRVHFMPFRTIMEEDTTVKDACEIITEAQSAIYRHGQINPLEVIEIWKKVYNVPEIGTYYTSSVTFQPVKLVSPDGINIETKWYGNGASGNPLYLTVMDGDGVGGLKFYYEYQVHVITLETIKKFHNYMTKVFEKVTSRDNLTVGDLLNIDPYGQKLVDKQTAGAASQ